MIFLLFFLLSFLLLSSQILCFDFISSSGIELHSYQSFNGFFFFLFEKSFDGSLSLQLLRYLFYWQFMIFLYLAKSYRWFIKVKRKLHTLFYRMLLSAHMYSRRMPPTPASLPTFPSHFPDSAYPLAFS